MFTPATPVPLSPLKLAPPHFIDPPSDLYTFSSRHALPVPPRPSPQNPPVSPGPGENSFLQTRPNNVSSPLSSFSLLLFFCSIDLGSCFFQKIPSAVQFQPFLFVIGDSVTWHAGQFIGCRGVRSLLIFFGLPFDLLPTWVGAEYFSIFLSKPPFRGRIAP